MASSFNPSFNIPHRQPAFTTPPVLTAPPIPAGTFAPGTKVQVGGHRVVIEKYLSEGGFAHVYLVRLPKAVDRNDAAVLKRVAVPDKESLASMRTEVETMKKLKGRHPIVTYIDSHASQLKGGGYEVFLLMEYCDGGGLIDFMNTRLKDRLTEPEILKIFSDVALGVACMHYLKPPLLHRDLKVENVLITSSGSSRRYKLCDFGSAAPPRPAATSAVEGRLIEDDVQKHTTLQYRSPEMIDVYRKQPIDEKSDIWALGVLLYKLCYYTTPFEEQGQMAILNASFKFPNYPPFSDTLKKLIASMLRENPQVRPNIYQVVREVCLMRGTDVPIKDIYAGRTASENRRSQQLPSPEGQMKSPPIAGAYSAPVAEETPTIPDIVPMRRGRPAKTDADLKGPKPGPSPMRGNSDPFAALDAGVPGSALVDEVSSRYPPLDEFSLLHDSGSKFAFDRKPEPATKPATKDVSQRVTEALADDVFARSTASKRLSATRHRPVPQITDPGSKSLPEPNANSASKVQKGASTRPSMVSTGTMTSPSPPPPASKNTVSSRPIYRFPPSPETRSSSIPRASDASIAASVSLGADALGGPRPGLLDHRSKSQIGTLTVPRSPVSSRPSLEGQRPSISDLESNVSRSRSTNSKVRPTSVHLESRRSFFRSRDQSRGDSSQEDEPRKSYDPGQLPSAFADADIGTEAAKITSNVDFLRAMEEEEPSRKKEKRLSSGSRHVKRASMPSISLSNTKSLLAGRFGDAFRRFETSTSSSNNRPSSPPPDRNGRELTPIAGSEATDDRSDDGRAMDETEEIPPEMRRELERRRLDQVEKQVAGAAAAYRERLNDRSGNAPGPPNTTNRAASIQSKVKTLLDETGRASPSPARPDRYRPNPDFSGQQTLQRQDGNPTRTSSQPVSRRPPSNGNPSLHGQPPSESLLPSSRQQPPTTTGHNPRPSAPPTNRPLPPSKPQALRAGERAPPSPAKPSSLAAIKPDKPLPQGPLDGTTDTPVMGDEDWELQFSKKYPSLAGLEMVETEIDGRARDV